MSEKIGIQEFCDRVSQQLHDQALLIAETASCLAVTCRALHSLDPEVAAGLADVFQVRREANDATSWLPAMLEKAARGEQFWTDQNALAAQHIRLAVDNTEPL